MLRISAINEAIQIAKVMESKGLRMLPASQTPLATLVEKSFCTTQDSVMNSGTNGEYEPDARFISSRAEGFGQSTRGDLDGHTRELMNLKDNIAKVVTDHMRYARSVASPVIVECINAFTNQLAGYHIDPSKDVKITMYDLPSILYDASMLQEVKKYAGAPARKVNDLALPIDINEEELVQKLSGDKEVATWLALLGDGFLPSVWSKWFTNITNDSLSYIRDESDLDMVCAMFLLAQVYMDSPMKGVNSSLANYSTTLAAVRDTAANVLSFVSDQMQSYKDTGMIIKNHFDTEIVVVKPVFDEWTYSNPRGLIIAACSLKNPPRYVKQLTEQADQLIKKWELHVASINRIQDNTRFMVSRDILESVVQGVVAANAKKIYGPLVNNPETFDLATTPEFIQFKKRLGVILTKLEYNDFKNVSKLMTLVVGKCVFYFSSAYEILSGIDEAMEQNPKLSLNEAAYLARVKYIANWCFDQTLVTAL
jgi:hypothetical protein